MSGAHRVLIANRGEIAVRIINACRSRGLETVLAVSEADRNSLGARLADRAVCVGPSAAARSYLSREALVTAALGTGCGVLHPGYGFLAEDHVFAAMCREAGVTFVGPRPEQLELFGDKVASRHAAERAGVPVSPGSPPLDTPRQAVEIAGALGYPVLLKAVAGGGGRGMRIARHEGDLVESFHLASAEAAAAFGNPRLYLERWVADARHVEVQVAGDGTGHAVHLGDRDCSVQRRNQKLIEEAPAPGLDRGLSEAIRASAVQLAQDVGYDSVGTVEFLVDRGAGEFFFLEMNPRIQVEHGVSELVTGVDIVQLQLAVALAGRLELGQDDITVRGAAIECRINAEDPEHGFRPSPGTIARWNPPSGEGIRIDTHCFEGYVVPPFYDSLLAKVMTVDRSRAGAVTRMAAALDDFVIEGIDTNVTLSRHLIEHPDFLGTRFTTRWLDELIERDPRVLARRAGCS